MTNDRGDATAVLVLGAIGMLGHAVLRFLAASPGFSVTGSIRSAAGLRLLPPELRTPVVTGVDVENADNQTHLEGSVMLVGLEVDRVLNALDVLQDQSRGPDRTVNMVRDYQADNVSDKVLRIILSYTSFVNRRVWHRE